MDKHLARIKLIGGAILLLLALIVVIQNTESVETQILFTSLTMPRAALLIGTMVVGFVLGVITAGRMINLGKTVKAST